GAALRRHCGRGGRRRAYCPTHQPGQLPRQDCCARKKKSRGTPPLRGGHPLEPRPPAGRPGKPPRRAPPGGKGRGLAPRGAFTIGTAPKTPREVLPPPCSPARCSTASLLIS